MICITGATGFVGRQILRLLVDEDIAVRIIVRDVSQLDEKFKKPGIEVVETDDLFNESHENLVKRLHDIDTLIHSAWYTEPGKYLTSTINLNCLQGTIALAKAFKAAGGRRFVGIGTCAEYDLNAGFLRTTTPLKPTTLYAACKASVYQILSQLLPPDGVEFVWCRLFYLYGESEDPRRFVPYLRQQLASGKPAELTSGNQVRDFLDVREAGSMIAKTALSQHEGPINICSGIPVTVRQLAEQIADEYGRRHLLHFGVRPENLFDPACVVGVCPSLYLGEND